ncbi:unnamed protein product, partial [Peniophora sp. CBMAI 1063]
MSFRRSNKSHKVPNVKLRPVQHSKRRTPPPLSTPTSSPPNYNDHDEELSGSFVDPCPRPLRGVVLCATGVDKSEVFSKAQELGASTSYDFTDRVTHLIAVEATGQKYQCAVERQIPILKPSWILDNHEIWLRGDMFSVPESIEEHRLPPFTSIILCLSGFTSLDQRTEINRLVTKHGGAYVKELRRPVKVTHLLCTGEEETDKMRYARRFNQAGEANIKLVWEEWFFDCIRYGGRFNEEPYSVDLPRPLPKPLTQPTPSQQPFIGHAQESHSLPPPPRPLVSASTSASNSNQQEVDEDEVAPARAHVPAVTLQVWESLLKRRGYVRSVDGAGLVRSPSKPPPAPDMDVDDQALPLPQPKPIQNKPTQAELWRAASQAHAELHPDRKGHSALSTFSRTNSFAKSKLDAEGASKQPFRRSQSIFAPLARASPVPQQQAQAGPSTTKDVNVDVGNGDGKTPVFAGLKFRALGEAKSASVRAAVESCAGVWIDSADVDDESVDYIIVRLVSGSAIYRAETDEALQAKYRTECWLEGCLTSTSLLPASHHPTFTPLPFPTPVPLASRVILSHSGLDAAEETWIKRLMRALGAGEWGVRVVGMEWVAQVVQSGEIPGVDAQDMSKGKGKGKEREAIVDVTNTATRPSAVPAVQKAKTMPDVNTTNRAPSRAPSLQKQALERARTAPVDEPGPLGKQTLLLSSRSKSKAPTPAPPPAPPTRTTPAPLPPAAQTTPAPPTRLSTLQPHPKPADSGSDTEPEPEEDELPPPLPFPPGSRITGVPSSRTPSPMKMPPSDPSAQRESSPLGPPSSPAPGPRSSPAPAPASQGASSVAQAGSSPAPTSAAGSSPLKPNPATTPNSPVKRTPKSSPMRPAPVPAAAARALHESMSVLGKRASSARIEEPEPPRRRKRRPRPRPAAPPADKANDKDGEEDGGMRIRIPEVYETSASYEIPSYMRGDGEDDPMAAIYGGGMFGGGGVFG